MGEDAEYPSRFLLLLGNLPLLNLPMKVSEVVCESVSKMEVEEELLKFAVYFCVCLGGERDQLIQG